MFIVEVKITYEVLFDILRREKDNNELQALDNSFYDDVQEYVSSKRQSMRSQKSSGYSGFGEEKSKIQMRNILRTVKEIYNIRERKILGLARTKARSASNLIDTTKILPVERALFDRAVDVLEERRDALLEETLGQDRPGKTSEAENQGGVSEGETVNVEIGRKLPKFLGTDKKVYGPFDEGDVVELPDAVAELLIKKGRATKLDSQ